MIALALIGRVVEEPAGKERVGIVIDAWDSDTGPAVLIAWEPLRGRARQRAPWSMFEPHEVRP